MLSAIVEVPLLPRDTESATGEAVRLKLSRISENVVEEVSPPPTPVTVMVWLPVGAVAKAVMFAVQVPEPGAGMGLGEKLMFTPVGTLLAVHVTGALNPPETALVMANVVLPPTISVLKPGGGVESVKLPGLLADTFRMTVAVVETPFQVVVTVIG